MKTQLMLLVLFLGLNACAKPNYVSRPSAGGSSTGSAESEKSKDQGLCKMQFKKIGLCMSYNWISYPKSTKEAGRLLFKFYRQNAADQTPVVVDFEKDLKVFLWMPSMGHGSAPVRWVKRDIGTYEAYNIYFIMAGDWDLHFRFQDGAQVIDEVKLSLIY